MLQRREDRGHILAWAFITGRWPKNQVDHKNRVKNDNKASNLREATNKQNHENMGLICSNTSGVRGVSFCQQTGRWLARITHNGREKNLGRFHDIKDATAVRKAAEARLYTHSEACQ